jgi:hypothetical protein
MCPHNAFFFGGGGRRHSLSKILQCYTTYNAFTAVATATATSLPALITLPDKRYPKTFTSNYWQNKGPLSNESTYMGLRPMLCDQDIFRFHLFLPEPTEYFNLHFCSCVCLRIPVLCHSVVTTEIHIYLQNSNILPNLCLWLQTSSSTTYSILFTSTDPCFHSLSSVTDNRRAQTCNLIRV